MITKIAFVAQPTKNMDAMKTFYGETLGLAAGPDYQMWAEFECPDGKTVALDTFSAQMDDARSYMALESDDIEADVERLKDAGATISKDVWSNDHDGKHICKMAIVQDPDGNPVMIHQIAPDRVEHPTDFK